MLASISILALAPLLGAAAIWSLYGIFWQWTSSLPVFVIVACSIAAAVVMYVASVSNPGLREVPSLRLGPGQRRFVLNAFVPSFVRH